MRNRADGSVELEAEGPQQALHDLRLWCEKGPALARVRWCHSAGPSASWQPIQTAFARFTALVGRFAADQSTTMTRSNRKAGFQCTTMNKWRSSP